MAAKCICPADLDKRIEIQKSTESVDSGGYGDVTPTWSRLDELWAKIEPTGSREFYRASQVYAAMTHLVTIRYRRGLTPKMRVVYRDQRSNVTRYFGITGIIDPDEAHILLQLACTEAA